MNAANPLSRPPAAITLTTIGSRGVTVSVAHSYLAEAPAGVAITLGLSDGPLTLALTDDERRALVQALGGEA